MPTEIYVVRHAEPHNPDRVIYGRMPGFRLSDRGRQDAQALAGRLADSVQAAAIYSSPLLRARQTAAAILRLQPQVRTILIRSGLLEVRNAWEGRPLSDIVPDFNYYEPPLGITDETIADLFIRMDRTLRAMAQSHPHQKVICVSHGDPIAALRTGYRQRPLHLTHMRGPDYPQLASVTVLTFTPSTPLPAMQYWD